ncbi:N-acyl homoserine lactonase family protein [Streptomyces sp. JV176]|uniref:N-acyl homoserine lactonase family protein n=1 Tax=Streptomyces sp. JV176 TaxID=858630 RepID=UPI002E760982|nr:N-acyl homoserine lactonase family protein [Streptomyces sp. JV176]MEE1799503.1 N-acyl homoserine lactonase family protein [Streptomyces sp. JV176]
MKVAEPGVYAVRFARAETTRSNMYLRYRSYREEDGPMFCDFYFWVLVHPEGIILFDTGFDDRYPVSIQLGFEDGLAALGLTTADVDQVVVSHLHSDHTGNIPRLTGARFLVPEQEWRFWTSPMGRRGLFAGEMLEGYLGDLATVEREGRLQTTGPGTRIAAGVRTMSAAGHTAGSQILIVDSPHGSIALASDAAHFREELDLDRPFSIASNVADMYTSFDMLRELERQGTTVIPGHESTIADAYPRVSGDGGVPAVVRTLDLTGIKRTTEED